MKKIGRYQITRELGRGAMGVVFHAIDPTIGRPVAIKTLRLREVDDADQRLRLRERLFREARSAGALSHPGIVTIYDMDEVDGLAYIAMEYVDGETLDDILSRPQGLTRDRLIEVLNQAAAALDYAHRKGIIHRDIKPANVMIDITGAVKITDFGIAKITQLEGQTLTGAMIGTPNYMSPEQVQGQETDGRSDQFSLGVIAYEMLTGERPFHGEQISTVVYKIVAEQPVPVQNVNTTLNSSVDKALRKGLAKKPERRYSSCSAFASSLTTSLANAKSWRVLPRKAHQNLPTAATDAVTGTFRPVRKIASEASPRAKSKKRGSLFWPFVGAFLLLLAALSIFVWQAGDFPGQHAKASAEEESHGNNNSEKPDSNLPSSATDPTVNFPDRPSALSSASKAPAPVAPPAKNKPEQTSTSEGDTPTTFQQVQVMTDPAEARASLDNNGDAVCQTPCRLRASSGVHTVTVTRDGYQAESREIHVGHEDFDVPLITLRGANGLLLLTSEPSAAHVWIDGKPTDFRTPISMSLSTGPHNVLIRKDGLQSSGQVTIQNGALSTLKLSVIRQ